MIKKIKQISKVGIYREFSCEGSACFSKFNAFYGFNGSGKSTLAKIFQALDGTALDYKETGTKVILEDYEKNNLEIKEGVKHREILIYDEDFIVNNLKWDQGIKSFVVIGKRSKQEEEELKKLYAKKDSLLIEKKITEASIKKLTDIVGGLATEISGELRKELIQYNSAKYNSYNKKPFQVEVENLKIDKIKFLEKNKIPELKQKITQTKLEKVEEPVELVSRPIIDVLEEAISFCEKVMPTKEASLFSQAELQWLDTGLNLHREKEKCLFCLNDISKDRKELLQKDLTSQVSSYLREGKLLVENLSRVTLKLPAVNSKMFYPEIKSNLEDVVLQINETINSYLTLITDLKNDLNRKIEFDDSEDMSLRARFSDLQVHTNTLKESLIKLIEENNRISDELENQKSTALLEIERIYFKDFIDKTTEVNQKIIVENEKNKIEEESISAINLEISGIEASLESAAKAIEGINNMIHIFLGRADLRLEYKKDTNKFEITRKNLPAKRLSEGEKTAIAVCYFLILVNSNPDKKRDLIVVVDDPISSLDTNNLYNAYAVLKNNLQDVKQLFILTHNLYFYRLVWKWYKDLNEQNSCFKIETSLVSGEITAKVIGLTKGAKETSTEYILLYSHLKEFIKRCSAGNLTEAEFLPYPNILRRLIEAYLFTKFPGKHNKDFENILISLGVAPDIARKADRFCNDFSHARFDSIFGQDGNSLAYAPDVVRSLIGELERIDESHFSSMSELI